MRVSRRAGTLAAALTALSALVAAWCSDSGTGARPSRAAEEGPLSAVTADAGRAGRSAPQPKPEPPATRALPGLGPKTAAAVPANARQAVVVAGAGPDSFHSSVTLYRRDPATGWTAAGPAWPAHNAAKGWTDHHLSGDLRSPVGVYTLSDAGGRLPDPGSALPYDHAPIGFRVSGTGVRGEPLDGAFDYVIAIDYNRVPGTSPRDWTRPLGQSRGGGIWLHVDHRGPTEGCVSLSADAMRTLLRTLDPGRHPVVVMGDAAALAR